MRAYHTPRGRARPTKDLDDEGPDAAELHPHPIWITSYDRHVIWSNKAFKSSETDFVANTPDFQELVRDIAMHIAAAKPRFATRDEVTQEILDKEKEIAAHVAKESGKPVNIIEKIVTGKMEKFYEENCVLEQPFVKDTNITVGELIKQKIALLGENIVLGRFSRFEI